MRVAVGGEHLVPSREEVDEGAGVGDLVVEGVQRHLAGGGAEATCGVRQHDVAEGTQFLRLLGEAGLGATEAVGQDDGRSRHVHGKVQAGVELDLAVLARTGGERHGELLDGAGCRRRRRSGEQRTGAERQRTGAEEQSRNTADQCARTAPPRRAWAPPPGACSAVGSHRSRLCAGTAP